MTDEKKPYASVRIVNKYGVLQVLDARGRNVEGIIAVDMAIRPGRPPIMRLNMAAAAFEIEGTPSFAIMDPGSKQLRPVKRIEFSDGGPPFEAPDIVGGQVPGGQPAVPAGAIEISAVDAARIRDDVERVAAAELERPAHAGSSVEMTAGECGAREEDADDNDEGA